MTETLAVLLLAHLLGDFIFQTDRIARSKRSLRGLAEHGLHVGALSALAVGAHGLGAVWAILVGSHILVDHLKAHVLDKPGEDGGRFHPLASFAIDQAAHLFVVLALVEAFPDAARSGVLFLIHQGAPTPDLALQAMVLASALIVLIPVGSIVIGLWLGDFVDGLSDAGASADDGLPGAGKVIGWLERFLVLALTLAGSVSAVGFVVAAKSVLRLGEINTGDRATSEYIIIGTLMSFAWAVLVSLVARSALAALGAAPPGS